jgi:hypothetical protein
MTSEPLAVFALRKDKVEILDRLVEEIAEHFCQIRLTVIRIFELRGLARNTSSLRHHEVILTNRNDALVPNILVRV